MASCKDVVPGVGFYVFTSEQDGHEVQWVDDHIRPRVRVRESWGWPVGVSLSMEIGYQRAVYSTDTWTWEVRPIVDKALGRRFDFSHHCAVD